MGRAKPYLNDNQKEAIRLAHTGMKWSAISKRLGVAEKTVWEWRTKNVLFQAELTAVQDATLNETALEHRKYINDAFETLHSVVVSNDPEIPTSLKINASTELIQVVHKNVEVIKIVEQNKRSLNKYYEFLKQYLGKESDPEFDEPIDVPETYDELEAAFPVIKEDPVEKRLSKLNEHNIPLDVVERKLNYGRGEKVYDVPPKKKRGAGRPKKNKSE